MFGSKTKKLTAAQNNALKKAREGQLLTEDEMMVYVKAHQILNPDQLKGEVRVYSVLWFDPTRKRSVVAHTKARDSIEAAQNVMRQIPPCVNCTSVVGHIPSTLRFELDELVF